MNFMKPHCGAIQRSLLWLCRDVMAPGRREQLGAAAGRKKKALQVLPSTYQLQRYPHSSRTKRTPFKLQHRRRTRWPLPLPAMKAALLPVLQRRVPTPTLAAEKHPTHTCTPQTRMPSLFWCSA
jgi:hypothetical protein